MSSRWTNKGKTNCANYSYWCDKLAKNCGGCDEYADNKLTFLPKPPSTEVYCGQRD